MLTLQVAVAPHYSGRSFRETLMRYLPQLAGILSGLLFGAALSFSLVAVAGDPLGPAPASETLPPWGIPRDFTLSGAILLAVWRGGALAQKVLDGGFVIKVDLTEDAKEHLGGLRCAHPNNTKAKP